MARMFVTAYLDSFTTQDSGDVFGEGEFYFKCNKKRYPDVGEFKLGKGETFNPEPNPTLWAAILDSKKKDLKLDFEVWEKDPGRDDKFIDKEIKVPLKPTKKEIELTDKKLRCRLKLILKIEEKPEW